VRAKNRWPQVIAVGALFFVSLYFVLYDWGGAGPDDPLGTTKNPSRVLEGRIVADGEPVAGVQLELREETVAVASGESGPDGRYAIEWKPRTTLDTKKLRLLATHENYAKTIRPPVNEFELVDEVTVEGKVIAPDGTPWRDVRVEIGSLGESYGAVRTSVDGSFTLDGLPRGAELEVFVEGGGVAPELYYGFTTADRLMLHALPGKRVDVFPHDPVGNAVDGATVRFAAPAGFTATAADGLLASGSSGYVVANAPDHLPVFLDAPVFGRVEAVLWPRRRVVLRVWDAPRKRGVFGVEVEVTLNAGPANADWNGPDAGRSFREFPMRMLDRRGEYAILLPRAPVSLRVSADGYGDRKIDVGTDESTVLVHMPPLREAATATVSVQTEERILLVVADQQEPWFAAFEAPGEVTVPAGRPLEIASAGASNGFWLPPMPIEPIRRGRRRDIRIPLRPAAKLIVQTRPATPCEITLVDKKFGKATPPLRVQSNGRAEFWVRPRREVKVSIQPRGNWRPLEADLAVEPATREWSPSLEEAAGLRLRVRDVAGNPVPFARVRYWEAAISGRLELRIPPERTMTDAAGVLDLLGLRRGPTPIEIVAHGFRTARPKTPQLIDGQILDGGVLTLQPAPLRRGRVLDPDGNPLGGVYLRTIGRGLKRLELPGGGARELYDLADEEPADAVSNAAGEFEVRDSTPRRPLLVADAPGRDDLAIFVGAVPANGIVTMARAADVALEVSGRVEGVYLLLAGTDAVRVYSPGPLRMNPIPLTLPAGPVSLFVRYRSQKWSAAAFTLTPGEQRLKMPRAQ
jgi:hypothetical protein